ncbi:MAG: hypothetical protein K9W46_02200 [Candidatus Heimdallarchaeum endolithica]|uniref:Uncharacterized protein n=1 Tax=Candidatus Heimdallarchaeum endolithica TaxID=2876572 RepID=A0A9Y1FP13_9ARCH|nr:MAG: hypothetical protein K9W46_02200 [Candidatus Heimdallarchaeum endolithica]
MEPLKRLYFTTIVGTEHKQIPFETPGSIIFHELIVEVSKKFGISTEQIAISSEMGETLTVSDFQSTVDEIIRKYGTAFQVINRGVVGL